MKQSVRWVLAVAAALAAGSAAPARGGNLAANSAPDQAPVGTVELTEVIGRRWPVTMLTHEVTGPAAAGLETGTPLAAVDEQGHAAPAQVTQRKVGPDGATLAARVVFQAGLEPFQKRRIQLVRATAATATEGPQVRQEPDALVLDNGKVAVRLPAVGRLTYPQPIAFASDHRAAVAALGAAGGPRGPIHGIRLADSRWVGGSFFFASAPAGAIPSLLAQEVSVVAQGPLLVEALVRYELDQGRWYQCRVQLRSGESFARIDELYDLGVVSDTSDAAVRFVLSGPQWKPDTWCWWINPWGQSKSDEKTAAGQAMLQWLPASHRSRFAGSSAIAFGAEFSSQVQLEPWFTFGGVYAVAVVQGDQVRGVSGEGRQRPDGLLEGPSRPGVPGLAVVPLHAGAWRLDGPGFERMLGATDAGDVTLSMSMAARSHPASILHSGQWDPQMPYTTGRRLWALVAGEAPGYDTLFNLRHHDGYINLDDYKDWQLDWSQDAGVQYPRLVFGPDDVTRVKANLQAHPFADMLKDTLYLNDAPARRDQLLRTVTRQNFTQLMSPYLDYAFQRFRTTQELLPFIGTMDELLSSGELEPALRAELRQRVAVLAQMVAHPDFTPRGSMVHLGNPNMAMNRFSVLALLALLIPDHPQAPGWIAMSAQELKFQLAKNTAPGGGWSEVLTYYESGANHLVQAALALRRAGALDDVTARQALQVGLFPLDFMGPPHPAFNGARMFGAWGHEGWDLNNNWAVIAALGRLVDADAADHAMWAWNQQGRPVECRHIGLLPQVMLNADLDRHAGQGARPPLLSRYIPGVGVVMRAHGGDPDETFLAYRSGYCISHADSEQNSFILQARGAPLLTMSLIGYALHQQPAYVKLAEEWGWYSRPKWGNQDGGTYDPSTEIRSASFHPLADYVHAGASSGYRHWNRQMILVKGDSPRDPSYVVMRDSQQTLYQQIPMEWSLRTDGPASSVKVHDHGMTYTSRYGAMLEVKVLEPANVAGASRDASVVGPVIDPARMKLWLDAGSPVEKVERFVLRVPETLTVTKFGPVPHDVDVVALLQPRRADEPVLASRSLGKGGVRVESANFTDHVWLSPAPQRHAVGSLVFHGTAAVVRSSGGQTTVTIAEASIGSPATLKIGRRTWVAHKPMQVTVPTAELDREMTQQLDATLPPIARGLDAAAGEVRTVAAGVQKQDSGAATHYWFTATRPRTFDEVDGFVFQGLEGGASIDKGTGAIRLTVISGTRITHKPSGLAMWGQDGPMQATFFHDRIEGVIASDCARVVTMKCPAGLDVTPYLWIGGTPWAPGKAGDELLVAVQPGVTPFTITRMDAPPVSRVRRHWPME